VDRNPENNETGNKHMTGIIKTGGEYIFPPAFIV
jgi:hypothetical protein